MLENRKTFKGGFSFKKLRGAPRPQVEEVPLPGRVVIPLKQGYGSEVQPTVKPQDKVTAGQVIGIDDASISSPVHATANGTVEDIIKIKYPDGDEEVSAVVIAPNGASDRDGWTKIEGASQDYRDKGPDEIGNILYMAGVTSLGPSGFPTKHNTSSAMPETITDIIISAVSTEPFYPANETLLEDNIDEFTAGVEILKQALPQANVHIGVNCLDKEIINVIAYATKDMDWVRVHPLKPKYPQEHEVVLTSTILGKTVPYGGHAADIGVIILDLQATLHAYEAVVEGKPLIERTVSLGGGAYKDNVNARVRVGTPIEHVIAGRLKDDIESRVLLGGIMTGQALGNEDLSIPVSRATTSITALKESKEREFLTFIRPGVDRHSFSYTFLSSIIPSWLKRSDTNLNGELRPCVACTFCTDACPVDIMPHLVSKYVTFGPLEETLKLKIHACIDCGLCTYVCPAKIPLMTDIQEGRKRIEEELEEEEVKA